VFTQTTWDEEGFALRDPDSTTYTGAIETAEEFGKRIYREALTRGWNRAKKKVVIGDGAEWIRNLVAEHFPGAIQIVDLYHARQHLWAVARQLYPQEEAQQKAWMKVHQKRLLDKGKIEKLVGALRAIYTGSPAMDEKIRTEADYFARNAERMRYPKFRRQHWFVGSGVIEAGCKTVIGLRRHDIHFYVARPWAISSIRISWMHIRPAASSFCQAIHRISTGRNPVSTSRRAIGPLGLEYISAIDDPRNNTFRRPLSNSATEHGVRSESTQPRRRQKRTESGLRSGNSSLSPSPSS